MEGNWDMLVNTGIKNLTKSGSLLRHRGDFLKTHFTADAYILADLRELDWETFPGVAFGTFLTPYQGRLFCTCLKNREDGKQKILDQKRGAA